MHLFLYYFVIKFHLNLMQLNNVYDSLNSPHSIYFIKKCQLCKGSICIIKYVYTILEKITIERDITMIIVDRKNVGKVPSLTVVKAEKQGQALPTVVYFHGFTSAKEHNLP